MRHVLVMIGMVGGLALGASQAQAAPVLAPVVVGQQGIEQVAGGCGPGGHRDRFGNCRPNYRPAYRACPPGYAPTPYGCRPRY